MKNTLVEVNDPRTKKEFLLFPVHLYKNDPNWIRPLDKDVESVFDPAKNKLFRHGECIRWILIDENGQTIGRVASFVDHNSASKNDQPTGGMGFFECIQNKEAAYMLFDACRDWLKSKGMEAMDGPVNFGERDRWWGLLIEGFTPPNYLNNYNPPYYREFFESYGFRDYFRQLTFGRPITGEGVNPLLWEKADRIFRNPDYSFVHYHKKDMKKFMNDFLIIYNKGWARFPGVKALTNVHVQGIFSSIKPILDDRLLWYAYHKGEPIAFFLCLPEINVIIRKLNGKLGLIEKLRFAYYLWRKECKKAFGFVFGVVPEFHAKGVEAAIIKAFANVALKPGFQYTQLEMNWIGDFNQAMVHMLEELGSKVVKTLITYRLLFDSTKEFKRHKRLS